jgi:Uma2 family endonuclease
MNLVINDIYELKRLIRRRRRLGHDRFDEIWDGVYVMSPQPNNEHFVLAGLLNHILLSALDRDRVIAITQGGNLSDRPDDWKKNFRCPDGLVFLRGNRAEDRGSHWFGGPDFAIEIISPRDRSREKFDFYASVHVGELLLVDRRPWRLELYRLNEGAYETVGKSTLARPDILESQTLGLNFRLIPGERRPQIEVSCPADGRTWLA